MGFLHICVVIGFLSQGQQVMGADCATDGTDYTYTESVSGDTRTIVTNVCPNHPWKKINPNDAYGATTTYTIPANPQFVGTATSSSTSSANIDVSEEGGATGILFNGAMLFSPFGGPNYGSATGYTSSATYAEGDTFDQCGCHASQDTSASYHCHVPPTCLLRQLGQGSGHSPQVGWSLDGFPMYGPLGPGGVEMQTCTVTGGTYGTDVCTDDCGGYYNDGSIDDYKYRYYIQGTYNDGTSCDYPGCPMPGADYFPNTPVCIRGCCPSGVSCSSTVTSCSGTYENGYTSSHSAAAPTINGMSVASGLPTNTGGCAYGSLTSATCSSSDTTAGNTDGGQSTQPTAFVAVLAMAMWLLK